MIFVQVALVIHGVCKLAIAEITSRAYVCGGEDSRPGYKCQKPQFSKRELAQLLILAQSMIHTRYVCVMWNIMIKLVTECVWSIHLIF